VACDRVLELYDLDRDDTQANCKSSPDKQMVRTVRQRPATHVPINDAARK
jgi:hypothetical protein